MVAGAGADIGGRHLVQLHVHLRLYGRYPAAGKKGAGIWPDRRGVQRGVRRRAAAGRHAGGDLGTGALLGGGGLFRPRLPLWPCHPA